MHLFAGAGGGILADLLLGHQPVCAVEINEYCQQVLSARQKDGFLPWFPIFADVTQFDGRPWRGIVDVISGGFPCQDISWSGKRRGLDGERSGLWREFARIIREVQPRFTFVENTPGLLAPIRRDGNIIAPPPVLAVLGDLAEMGYNARWGVIGGGAVGSLCEGERIWIVAFKANGTMLEGMDVFKTIEPCPEESRRREFARAIGAMFSEVDYARVKRNPDDVARGMDRLKAIGNGQNPAVAAIAWEILTQKKGRVIYEQN